MSEPMSARELAERSVDLYERWPTLTFINQFTAEIESRDSIIFAQSRDEDAETIKELREALKRYGVHASFCASYYFKGCSCGFSALTKGKDA